NPFEVGLARAIAKSKSRHVGRHALAVLGTRVARRLAGFIARDARAGDIEDCLLVIEDGRIAGRVTSVGTSPSVGAVIGLVMVEQALAEPGRRIAIRLVDGSLVTAEIAATPFYDADNARQAADAAPAPPPAAALPPAVALSPVLDAYARPDFVHVEGDGARHARRAGARPAAAAWLVDLSHLPQRLVVGAGAPAYLAGRGLALPAAMQSACSAGADGLVVRTHVDEYLVLGAHAGGAAAGVALAAPGRDGDVLVLVEERAHFALLGTAWEAVFAELCAAPPTADAAPAWRALRLAHCEVAVWQPPGTTAQWRLLASCADARFLFDTLADCIAGHGGALATADEFAALTAA
ncbi:MAG: glycine cleavage T C-terminal barrel domain-containing protein, partial [Gammaproteobacteria bacterium]